MNKTNTIDIGIEHLVETTSTNDYLAQLCQKGETREFHTVTCEYQTAGKGQRGNVWEAEKGKNLLFSTVLYPTALEAKEQFYLSMLAAVAIVETLNDYKDHFYIKWPNDIYWKERKIGGILIENELEGKYIQQCIIGVGLNVNQTTFLSDAPNPVSLKQIVGADINPKELLKKILHGIAACYCELERDFDTNSRAIRTLYLNRFYRREGLHPYRDARGTFRAEFHQVEPSGHLVLKDEAGTLRRYAFKEIEYLPHETD